jgi:hypothetical protein
MDWLSVLEQGPRSRKRRGYLPFFCKVSPLLWRKICFVRTKEKKLIFNFSNVNNNNALSARYISRRRDLSLSSFLPHHVKASSSSSSSSGSSGSRVTLREWRGVVVVFKTSSREENGAEGVKGGCKE